MDGRRRAALVIPAEPITDGGRDHPRRLFLPTPNYHNGGEKITASGGGSQGGGIFSTPAKITTDDDGRSPSRSPRDYLSSAHNARRGAATAAR